MLRLGRRVPVGCFRRRWLSSAAFSSDSMPFARPPVPCPGHAAGTGATRARPASIRAVRAGQGGARSARRSLRHRDFIGIVDFTRLAANSASMSSTCATARSRAIASPMAAGRTPTIRASSSCSRTIRLLRELERHLHHRRLLSGQIRPFDEGAGLDWTNNNAESRAIVIHNAWYAEPEMIAQHGKLGRWKAASPSAAPASSVMNRLNDGRMIYADKLA